MLADLDGDSDASSVVSAGDLGASGFGFTWTPKVCRIMVLWAIFRGVGPLF